MQKQDPRKLFTPGDQSGSDPHSADPATKSINASGQKSNIKKVLSSMPGADMVDAASMKTFVDAYDGSINPETYAQGMIWGWHAGNTGSTVEYARSNKAFASLPARQIRPSKFGGSFNNSDRSRAKTVELSLDNGNGKLLIIEAVPDSAAKTIHIISARRTKKGSSRVSNAKALNGTPKNVNGSASNGNVPKVKENGNSYFSGRGNGYSGYSMSNNAVDAYENGEKPISKWTKADIIGAVTNTTLQIWRVVQHRRVTKMNEKDLEQISLDFIIEKFGKEYIEKMNGKVCLATGKCTDDMYQYFVGFKGQKEYPPKGKVFRGWSVYALVYLDVHTGEIISFNYQTE